MDIKLIIKSIEVNKLGTTNQCFSSQACSGLAYRRNQSSIAYTINGVRVLELIDQIMDALLDRDLIKGPL